MSVAFNIPNTLTWFRIACIPLVVLVYYLPYPWAQPAAAWIFGAAAITDGLDGYLARKLNQMSKFGAFLDPVADKVTVAVALLLVTHTDSRIIVLLVAAVIIGREITISALREWMAGIGERGKVAVIDVAKYKTLAQMFGVAFMLHGKGNLLFGIPVYEFGLWLLVIAAGLTLWSMFVYLKDAWPKFTAEG
ncbi:MAG: CDP-diacylglycerol--glycerol-3-phosphate 3-phosphatidyltransferase [Chromatiales bacterium]|nr:CDP-diacylglycerol--glycerol-3-phosphate 3-phosphatidyltransferase [Chromatiales bacterium]MDH3931028.1 CDP-diacylglycerol--glycerol-3-phosphate 3-phosphatidyltransferase [Chromatiales bacterium]MDH4015632.1 CDP-diacylglycerol--glycerol-3-phosphate 3-phosphatidyltransferase [Chromatiales bacterium]PLX55703.1 MAG: CDP-diacylglycerol--glycerol-3-phosphate 3-phosphatidyltransferase [Chromatiales bacterium]